MIGPRIRSPKWRVWGMATNSPPRTSRTFTKARNPLAYIPPINIAAGDPAGGVGTGRNFRKKFRPNTMKIRPRTKAVICVMYFMILVCFIYIQTDGDFLRPVTLSWRQLTKVLV